MRYGILGGALDPPHTGHLAMAKAVLEANLVDEVLLMPCYSHAYDKNMASAKHRFDMCFFAVGTHISSQSFWLCGVKACDFEIRHKMSGRTIEMIKKLQSKSNYTYDLIIGADNANTIDQWYEYEKLIASVRFIIIPREGQDLYENGWYKKPPHCILPVADLGYSSTKIRELLKSWWETKEHEEELNLMLNPRVFDYIKQHKLYR